MSSTYLKKNGKSKPRISEAFFSISCITISAIIGDRGEPIGVPKVCWYMMLLNIKKVECKTKRIAMINSFIGISTFRDMNSHLLMMLSMAKSNGMFVKRETTSRDINI